MAHVLFGPEVRLLLEEKDTAGMKAFCEHLHPATVAEALSGDLEDQILDTFNDLLTPADHKVRMDMRFYVEDVDAGLRAANRAGPTALAIGKAWAAVIRKAPNAKALLGRLYFSSRDYEEAIQWWKALPPPQRVAWKLTEPLHQTVLLSALKALEAGQYEQSADKIREAGKLGLRDRRLGPLLTLALVKAGQRLLYQ